MIHQTTMNIMKILKMKLKQKSPRRKNPKKLPNQKHSNSSNAMHKEQVDLYERSERRFQDFLKEILD